MALNTFKCKCLIPLHFEGLKHVAVGVSIDSGNVKSATCRYTALWCIQGAGYGGSSAAAGGTTNPDRLDSSLSRHDIRQLVRQGRRVSRTAVCSCLKARVPESDRQGFIQTPLVWAGIASIGGVYMMKVWGCAPSRVRGNAPAQRFGG